MTDHVVTSDIPFGDPGRGVYAYRVGDKVSADAVKENGWQEYVASATSKAGQDAVAKASGETSPASKGGNA